MKVASDEIAPIFSPARVPFAGERFRYLTGPDRESSMEHLIACIPKNTTEEIEVALTMFRNRQLVDMRVYFTDERTGKRVPTKKGISFRPEILTPLIDALQHAALALD